MANYVLFKKKQVSCWPPRSAFEERDGECRIRTVLSGGAAAKAGLKKSAVIIDIDGHPVRKIADTRLALWDKGPGEVVGVSIRGSPAAKTEHFEVILASTQTK